MSDDRHNPDLLAQLSALGEDPPDADELADAAALAEVLDAVRLGPTAIEAIDPHADRDDRLQAPLASLHLIRAAAGGDVLSDERRDTLWDAISDGLPQHTERTPAKVIPLFRRPRVQALFAAAAALLLAAFLGVFASIGRPGAPHPAPTSGQNGAAQIVAQIELDKAEARLRTIEADSLKMLMSARKAPNNTHGDHSLRDLRQARFDAVRARRQARARRL